MSRLLAAGDWQGAAQFAVETAKRHPEKLDAVIAHLEELDRQYTQEPLWGKTILHVLQDAGDFDRVIRIGQQMLSNPKYSRDLPDIYQLLALGYLSTGKEAEARRGRLRQVIAQTGGLLREQLRQEATSGQSAEASLEAIEHCVEAEEHLDRNANQAALLEVWLARVAQSLQFGQPAGVERPARR